MSHRTIITCALTGGANLPKQHPNFPVTPKQIAQQGLEAAEAGAAVLHIHVRDPSTGAPANDVSLYREVMARIREQNETVIINLTTGYGALFVPTPGRWSEAAADTNLQSAAKRIAHVVELKPEICTLDLATLQLTSAGNPAVATILMNLDPVLAEMAQAIQSAGVIPEVEIFESGDLARAKRMLAAGLLPTPGLYTMVLASSYGLPPTAAAIALAVQELPPCCTWTAMGVGAGSFPMAAQSFLMGGHVRVGLEDNLYLRKGVWAPSNAALVAQARQLIELLGGEIASAAEARKLLGLNLP